MGWFLFGFIWLLLECVCYDCVVLIVYVCLVCLRCCFGWYLIWLVVVWVSGVCFWILSFCMMDSVGVWFGCVMFDCLICFVDFVGS